MFFDRLYVILYCLFRIITRTNRISKVPEQLIMTDNSRPVDYSINLIWINKYADFSSRIYDKLLPKLREWATLNPGVDINFWYDSMMSSPPNIGSRFNIKNIREIPLVTNNSEIFTDKIPVYFRVDILKAIITTYYLRTSSDKYFVYSDLDVTPMGRNELFDETTVSYLDNIGIILAASKVTEYENSFHIVANKCNVLLAIDRILIELNLIRAHNALNGNLSRISNPGKSPISSLTESVFLSYLSMLKYLNSLDGNGAIYFCLSFDDFTNTDSHMNNDDVLYEYEKHGLEPMNTTQISYQLGRRLIYISDKKWTIPTKHVNVPLPKGYYDHHLPYNSMTRCNVIMSHLFK